MISGTEWVMKVCHIVWQPPALLRTIVLSDCLLASSPSTPEKIPSLSDVALPMSLVPLIKFKMPWQVLGPGRVSHDGCSTSREEIWD